MVGSPRIDDVEDGRLCKKSICGVALHLSPACAGAGLLRRTSMCASFQDSRALHLELIAVPSALMTSYEFTKIYSHSSCSYMDLSAEVSTVCSGTQCRQLESPRQTVNDAL
jgi:hypothetical protein